MLNIARLLSFIHTLHCLVYWLFTFHLNNRQYGSLLTGSSSLTGSKWAVMLKLWKKLSQISYHCFNLTCNTKPVTPMDLLSEQMVGFSRCYTTYSSGDCSITNLPSMGSSTMAPPVWEFQVVASGSNSSLLQDLIPGELGLIQLQMPIVANSALQQ